MDLSVSLGRLLRPPSTSCYFHFDFPFNFHCLNYISQYRLYCDYRYSRSILADYAIEKARLSISNGSHLFAASNFLI